jgi:hypothetical protein
MDEMPYGQEFQNAVNSFTKNTTQRLMRNAGQSLKTMLAIATEPFFRRELGERTTTTGPAGGVLWFGVLMVSPLPGFVIGTWYGYISAGVSLALLLLYIRLLRQNDRKLDEYRLKRVEYHSRSRGRRRFEDHDRLIRITAALVILLTSPIAGIAFIASMAISAKLAAEQQAEIYSKYLDQLDAKIEAKFMKDALLGKCAPEITYLYKPLPYSYDEEMREDIAEAWVGGIPKNVAQPPRPKGGTAAAATPEAEMTQPARTIKTDTAPPPPKKTNNRLARIGLVIALLAGVSAVAFWLGGNHGQAHKAAAMRPTPTAQVTQVPPTVSQPAPQTASLPVAVAPAASVLATPVQPKEDAAVLATQAEAQHQRALEALRKEAQRVALANQKRREELIELATTTIKEQADSVARFREACEARYAANPKKIDAVARSAQKQLREQYNLSYGIFTNVAVSQQQIMVQKQAELLALSTDKNSDPTAFCHELAPLLRSMVQNRIAALSALDALDTQIANAAPKRGFLFFK